MIRGNCPVCGRIFKVDDRYAGMTGRCKACGATIHVPGEPVDSLNGLPPASETPPQGAEPALGKAEAAAAPGPPSAPAEPPEARLASPPAEPSAASREPPTWVAARSKRSAKIGFSSVPKP